jgi:hypothetical protein
LRKSKLDAISVFFIRTEIENNFWAVAGSGKLHTHMRETEEQMTQLGKKTIWLPSKQLRSAGK